MSLLDITPDIQFELSEKDLNRLGFNLSCSPYFGTENEVLRKRKQIEIILSEKIKTHKSIGRLNINLDIDYKKNTYCVIRISPQSLTILSGDYLYFKILSHKSIRINIHNLDEGKFATSLKYIKQRIRENISEIEAYKESYVNQSKPINLPDLLSIFNISI